MGTKSRSLPFIWPAADWLVNYSPAPGYEYMRPPFPVDSGTVAARVEPTLQGTQVTTSESHPDWRNRKKASSGDIGGPFSSTRSYATLAGGSGSIPIDGIDGTMRMRGRYNGRCTPYIPGGFHFPTNDPSSKSALRSWGTSAIARVKPTNIFVDLSSSLAEILREGIPRLGVHVWESVTDAAREAANHHLAISFGFQPVVADIYKTVGAHMSADAKIEQYLKDAGKTVRRRYDLGVQAETTVSESSGGFIPHTYYSSGPLSSVFGAGGKIVTTRVSSRHRWFSGACTYSLPLDDSMRRMSPDDVRRAGLIDLSITPETLWNIAPWSWAVDWILPVGDLISNLQDHSTDSLVWTYAYTMEHSVSSVNYTYVGPGASHVGSLTLVTETKQRIAASPFGFGVDWNGLSPFQQSIVAALGISRR
jgi:hypothetical protein